MVLGAMCSTTIGLPFAPSSNKPPTIITGLLPWLWEWSRVRRSRCGTRRRQAKHRRRGASGVRIGSRAQQEDRMTFVTKKSLHRRTFLRGVGATVSLPLLDAMIPALSGKPLKSTPRLGFIYIANGVIQDQWIPKTTG